MKNFLKYISLLSLILSFTHCKEKVTPQPAAVKKGATLSLEAYNQSRKYSLNQTKTQTTEEEKNEKESCDCPCPCDDKNVKTGTETKTDPATTTILPSTGAAESAANPFLKNESMKKVFDKYSKSGIDDAEFDHNKLTEWLASESLSTDDQMKMIAQYFKIIENTNSAFGSYPAEDEKDKKLPLNERYQSIFDLYLIPAFASELRKRINHHAYAKLTNEEKNTFEAFLYNTQLSQLLTQYPQQNHDFDVYESVDLHDGLSYRTLILARIDFSKNAVINSADDYNADKSLGKIDDEEKNLMAVMSILETWGKSGLKLPDAKVENEIVGHANRTGNEAQNEKTALSRAKKVYDYIFFYWPNLEATISSMGFRYPLLKDEPKNILNKRVELVFSHEVVKAEASTAATTSDQQ